MQANQHRTSENEHPTFNIEHPTSSEEGIRIREFNDGEKGNRKFNLEERLLEFASTLIDLSESLPNTRAGNHIAGQILRSGTSSYPNHGEAEAAESRDDFVHKLKLCLKELRETRRWARLIERKGWGNNELTLRYVLSESDELTRISFCSIETAKKNALAERRRSSASDASP